MFILEFIIEFAIDAYLSLGLGTKEYKIENKLEKLSKYYPEVYALYLNNKTEFYKDEQLTKLIMDMNIKNEVEKEEVANYIKHRFISAN